MNNIEDKIDKEIWKPIPIEGITYHQVSNLGRFKNIKTGNYLKTHIATHGYPSIPLWFNNKTNIFLVHRLLAITFLDMPIDRTHQVNHINGIKTDNRLCNLEVVTSSENSKHAFKTGLRSNKKTPVNQLDKDTKEVIATFESILDAQRQTGIHVGSIGKACKGESKKAGGFKWEYVIPEHAKKNQQKRKVSQLDKDTKEVIATFDSIGEASRETLIDNRRISESCKGIINMAGGYKWKYA